MQAKLNNPHYCCQVPGMLAGKLVCRQQCLGALQKRREMYECCLQVTQAERCAAGQAAASWLPGMGGRCLPASSQQPGGCGSKKAVRYRLLQLDLRQTVGQAKTQVGGCSEKFRKWWHLLQNDVCGLLLEHVGAGVSWHLLVGGLMQAAQL